MNPRTWLTRWLPEPDGRAARLPLCLFGMMVTAVQTFGFVVFESLPLVAALPFSAFWILGWMAACDGRSLLVDLWRGDWKAVGVELSSGLNPGPLPASGPIATALARD